MLKLKYNIISSEVPVDDPNYVLLIYETKMEIIVKDEKGNNLKKKQKFG